MLTSPMSASPLALAVCDPIPSVPRPAVYPSSTPYSSASTAASGSGRRRRIVLRSADGAAEGGAEDPDWDAQREQLLSLDAQLTSFLGNSEGGPPSGPPARPPGPKKAKSNSNLGLNDDAVPEDQQPAQELADLKEAPLFSMAQQPDEDFLRRLGVIYGAAFVFPSLPIALITYPLFEHPIEAVLSANLGASAVSMAILIRLYVGWSYVGDRLEKDVGYYEESGWYDGFMALKPKEVSERDQLLFKFEVLPALQRVRKFLLGGAGVFALSVVLFKASAPSDPYAYLDDSYLANIRMDDQAAAIEQSRAASGKPTYCDSRYYRAQAGGTGC